MGREMRGSGKPVTGARQRLRERAEEMRYSLRELSLLIERNATYLTQYVNKGSPRDLTERDRQRLAFLLKVAPQELLDGTGEEVTLSSSSQPESLPPSSLAASAEVPVLSVALVGEAMGRIPLDQARESVERPVELAGGGNGFAVRVSGARFHPVFRPGDLLFVHPGIPPLPGDLVCVTTPDGRLVLGRLVSEALAAVAKILDLSSFQESEIPGARVEKVISLRYC